MDFLRTPWKTSEIENSMVSLANHHKTVQKSHSFDRYYCDLLPSAQISHNNKQWAEEEPEEEKANYLTLQEKRKQYQGLLSQTCGFSVGKKTAINRSKKEAFCSKVNRPGYMLGHELLGENKCKSQEIRKISSSPYRILNAPKLKDDFYTSLLDWGSNDIVSVVLDNAAYIWSSKDNETEKLIQGYISSIKWGKDLIIGEQTGRIKIIDVEKKKEVIRNRYHEGRIGTIDCTGLHGNLIASGSKDNKVMVWDVRSKEVATKFQGHRQQVCGVRWSFDGNMIASGGNDNMVSIWDMRTQTMYTKFMEHRAAVKALAWSPHQTSILATGGGSTDKCIKIWNTNEKKCVKTVETGSQVCNMMYSVNSNELVSTHGFSFNSINIWNAKDMDKIGTLTGHNYRVLYLARSPDGESILTGSGDQSLRFWKVFPSSSSLRSYSSPLELKNSHLR